eukprot:scaffold897_cov402-Prasinococcus_capsulatus_cf.AAC.75
MSHQQVTRDALCCGRPAHRRWHKAAEGQGNSPATRLRRRRASQVEALCDGALRHWRKVG